MAIDVAARGAIEKAASGAADKLDREAVKAAVSGLASRPIRCSRRWMLMRMARFRHLS